MAEQKVTIREVYKLIEDSQKNQMQAMKEGFKGVHDRQDTANHGIQKNTEHRLKTEATISTMKWLLGFIGSGTLFTLFKLFL